MMNHNHNGHTPDPAANGRDDVGVLLTPKQEAAALALASGKSVAQAARAAGCGSRTIRTWQHDLPEFNRRVHELRGEMTQRALGVLVASMTDAAGMLAKLARTAKGEQTRLLAARAVLEMGARLRENVEFEERLAALESRATTAATIFVSDR